MSGVETTLTNYAYASNAYGPMACGRAPFLTLLATLQHFNLSAELVNMILAGAPKRTSQ